MYDFIRGKLVKKLPTLAVIEANGVGYSLKISLNTSQKLPQEGEEVLLKTYLHVREEILQLYGFATEEERTVFLGLISVSGVGPKLAQTILSGLPAERLKAAIHQNDESVLSSISGIGKKTAQRLIVELKDKLGPLTISFTDVSGTPATNLDENLRAETIMALISLGYSKMQTERALQKLPSTESFKTVEDMIRVALKLI